MRSLEFLIQLEEAGHRVDRVLLDRVPRLSRTEVRRLTNEHKVKLNDRLVTKGDLVQAGDVLLVDMPRHSEAAPDAGLPLNIALETESVVIVEKPAGVATAPLRRGELGCIANALIARYPEMQGVGHNELEPGLLHRLDNNTSGLIIAARTEQAFLELTAGLRAGHLKKKYLGVTAPGTLPDQGELIAYVGPDPKHSRRVRCSAKEQPHSREGRVQFRVLQRENQGWLFELTVSRAYRHQLRAQLSFAKHPLLGDTLYHGPSVPGLNRHALHASYLMWPGGPHVKAFELSSPLPDDLKALLV
ncbi:MAG: hypothetical protein RJA70_1674 [Pseudomonadota bacterium]|jgi:23S rRNA pseudouridine1911/1915/1917 synthase